MLRAPGHGPESEGRGSGPLLEAESRPGWRAAAGLAVRGGGTSRPAPRIEEVSGLSWAGKRQGRGGGRPGGPATLTPQIPTPQVSSSWVLKPGSVSASICHRGPAQPHRSNPPVGVNGLEGGREGGPKTLGLGRPEGWRILEQGRKVLAARCHLLLDWPATRNS